MKTLNSCVHKPTCVWCFVTYYQLTKSREAVQNRFTEAHLYENENHSIQITTVITGPEIDVIERSEAVR